MTNLVQNREKAERWWSADLNGAHAAEFRKLSAALVHRTGLAAMALERLPFRTTDLAGVTPNDDVAVLCGPSAGRCVAGLAARLGARMPRVVVIAPVLRHDDVCLALANGATSYLVEGEPAPFLGSCLAEVIMRTAAGMSCLAPQVATVLLKRMRSAVPPPPAITGTYPTSSIQGVGVPTAREAEIMTILVEGRTVAEVATRLSLSPRTVRNHLARIYVKLGVHRQSEAVLAWLGHFRRTAQADC